MRLTTLAVWVHGLAHPALIGEPGVAVVWLKTNRSVSNRSRSVSYMTEDSRWLLGGNSTKLAPHLKNICIITCFGSASLSLSNTFSLFAN